MATKTRANHACQSCRLLKIRCIPNSSSLVTICENCDQSGKNCYYAPLAKTRRRKRADARVTELENEVRLLSSIVRGNERGTNTEGQASEAPENVYICC